MADASLSHKRRKRLEQYVDLLRVKPGCRIYRHGHLGQEGAVVFEGGLIVIALDQH